MQVAASEIICLTSLGAYRGKLRKEVKSKKAEIISNRYLS